jgi:hypothetical protein
MSDKERASLDRAIKWLIREEPRERAFWGEFALRVKETLATRLRGAATYFPVHASAYHFETAIQEADAAPNRSPDSDDVAVGTPTSPVNQFRRTGEYWTIVFEGKQVTLKDSTGLRYIRRLIEMPHESIDALELSNHARPTARNQRTAEADALTKTSVTASALPLLDRLSISQIKAALGAALEKASSSVDPEERAEAKEQAERLSRHLRESTYAGRPKLSGGDAEKARKAVSNAISRAIGSVSKVHAALAMHFRKAVNTGRRISYNPESGVVWDAS